MAKNKSDNTNVKRQPSQVGQFVARDLPTDKQVDRFDKYLKGDNSEASVDESLSEIYQDDGGRRVNVKQVDIKPQKSFIVRLAIILSYVLVLAVLAGGVYYWVINRGADSTAVDLKITVPSGLAVNQEFEYVIDYQNKENVTLTNLELSVIYPTNFIFDSSFPQPTNYNNKWQLEDLKPFSNGKVKIKGRLISPPGSSNMIFADLNYKPANISSEFKKSTSLDVMLLSSGLEITTTAPTSILVGQEGILKVKFKLSEQSFLDHFTIRFPSFDNLSFPDSNYGENAKMSSPGVFTISNLTTTEQVLDLKFKFTDKKAEPQDFKIIFEYQPDGADKAYVFEEKTLALEIIKNSLDLTIIANGQPSDQGVDFGQTINYTISYVNKGEITMADVIIMAVLDGEALDWRKLSDKNNGSVIGKTITWTKEEIPELASLAKDQRGTIDFSIPVREVNEAGLIRSFEIKSYAQFTISGKTEDLGQGNESNRSNQLVVKLNSDIALDEAVRYFDQDNIAVGTGPLPPQVGETTTFKVYWTITNSLHELNNLIVTTKLPNYVKWDNKEQTNAGTINYNQENNEVTWTIGRLPISANNLEAEFSVGINPRTTDRNKLLIIVSGTTLSGIDNSTTFPVSQILKAQTTRLEKDDIANTNGIVQ